MSSFSGAVDLFKSFFSGGSDSSSSRSETSSSNYSSSSNSETLYEPDKVKVAELENSRSKRLIEAQKDIIELNARMQVAVIEADARGFEHSVNVLKSLMSDMNLMAQQRLNLLENGHFETVEKIELMYRDLEIEVKKDNRSFQLEELPQMYEILEKFSSESASHKMYLNSIEQQIQLNITFVAEKLKGLLQRQNMLIESAVDTKKIVLEQSAKIAENRMIFLEKQIQHKTTLAMKSLEKPATLYISKQT